MFSFVARKGRHDGLSGRSPSILCDSSDFGVGGIGWG